MAPAKVNDENETELKRGRDKEAVVGAAVVKKAKKGPTKTKEEELRYDLAVAHRLIAKLGWDMLVWNHISARYDGTKYLITPGTKMWNRVKPSDLLLESDNVTANIIHSALYEARDDINAIIHLHTPAATAVSCLKEGFKPIYQDAAYFYNKVAYYDWDGVSADETEGPKIIEAVKNVPGCNTLIMNNHGFVIMGRSVKEIFVLAYYFEHCCDVQLRVMQSGGEIREPPKAVMEAAAKDSYLPEFAPGNCEWEALCGEVDFDKE